MNALLTRTEEREIRCLLDRMAKEHGLETKQKESFFEGFYIDRVWYKNVESEDVAVVAFEIERGVPSNERLRKDILNLATSRAGSGFVIVPHKRICRAQQDPWVRWYAKNFFGCLKVYRRPFECYIPIELLDADDLLKKLSLRKARIPLSRVPLLEGPRTEKPNFPQKQKSQPATSI